MSEPEDFVEYNSGSYCRHWDDPASCEDKCGACGCECRDHGMDNDCASCEKCPGWKETAAEKEP